MKKFSIFLFLVLGAKGLFADANATLTAAEFFVDTDPGEGSGTALQAADGAFDSEVESIVPKDLNVTGLAVGPHLIGVRFKDNNNTWGEVLFQTIHVYDPNPSGGGGGGGGSGGFATIKAAEYFVDTDPGEGNGVAFQAQDGAFDSEVESIVPKDLNVTGLAIGPHLVGVRFQENNNTWGEVLFQTIHVYDPNPSGGGGGGGGGSGGFATIKAAEYFVDTDPGEGNGVAFQAQDGAFDSEVESVLPKNLNVTGLAIGPHLVGVRYQENNNTWGEVLFQTIHVYDPNPAVGGGGGGSGAGGFSIITAAEYFIGTDPGEGNATALQPKDGAFDSEVESTLPTSLSMAGYPIGTYLVGVRYKDNNNTWGEVLFKTIEVDVDTDGDGLADKAEIYYETNASIPDTDGDGYLDGEEVAFGSDPTDANSLGNRAPLGLDFSGLAGILESVPVGTKVGDFNSTDTDANSTLRFALADGNGSTHNNLFSIDANGSLVTAAQLDYETNATLFVRTVVFDEHNYSFVRPFVLNVIDVVEDLDQDGIADHLDQDIDGDGFSNAEELAAGTDPHSPASKPTLQTGLVAWFPFDGNANDASGNGNHGTVHGATLGTDRHGRPGKAYGFDGADDYVAVTSLDGNHSNFGRNPFTFTSWVKPNHNVTHSNTLCILGKGASNSWENRAITFQIRHQSGVLQIDQNGPGGVRGETNLFDGLWHQVSAVQSSNKDLVLYIDGIVENKTVVNSGSLVDDRDTHFFKIGKRGDSSTLFNGSIDEVRIYDRALSAAEVQALYQLENTAPPPENNNTSPPGDGNQTDPNPPGDGNASNPGTGTGPNPPLAESYVPIVRTERFADSASVQRLFEGRILTDGGSAILETGFVLSRNINFQPHVRLTAQTGSNPNDFSVSVQAAQLEPGKLYYFRAFARNAVGENLGSIKKFRTPEQSDAWWAQMPAVGAGWRSSDWFGTFRRQAGTDWIYHAKLGWAYAQPDGKQGLWLWTKEEGWLWTQPGVFPHLWKHRSGNWLYLMTTLGGQPVFHDFASGSVR